MPSVTGRLLPGARNAIGSISQPYVEGYFTQLTAATITGDGAGITNLTVFGGSGPSHSKGAVPDPGASSGTSRYLREDGTWAGIAGINSGTVTSVGLSAPAEFTVTGAPVTGSGTITISRVSQAANTILSGPTTGAATTPTFRTLVSGDIPSLDWTKITTGKPTTRAGYGITDAEGTIASGTTSQYWRGDKTFQTLDKTAVGLVNVDNTADVNKPVSTATSNALALKADNTAVVHTTGSESLSGIKTFNSQIVAGTGVGFGASANGLIYSSIANYLNIRTGATALNFDNNIGSATLMSLSNAGDLLVNGKITAAGVNSDEQAIFGAGNRDIYITGQTAAGASTMIGLQNTGGNRLHLLGGKAYIFASAGMSIGTANDPGSGSLYLYSPTAGNSLPQITLANASGGAGNSVGLNMSPYSGRSGGVATRIQAVDDGNASANMLFYTAATGSASAASEKMRLTTSGGLNIGGTADPGAGSLQITSGTLKLRPSSGNGEAINATQSITGNTPPNNYSLYNIVVSSDTMNAASFANQFVQVMNIDHTYGGAGFSGSRSSLLVTLRQGGAVSTPANSVAAEFQTFSAINDGGFGFGAGQSKGGSVAMNPSATLTSGATYKSGVTSAEFNVAVESGASVGSKYIAAFVQNATDAVAGSINDAGIMFYKQNGPGASNVIQIGAVDPATLGNFGSPATATTGTILKCVGYASIGTALDFSAYDFGDAHLKFRSGGMNTGDHTTSTTRSIKVKDETGAVYYIRLYQ